MRIGVLTGGGDCPGLNAVIRGVVRQGITAYGHEFVGHLDGWKGPLENHMIPLGLDDVRGIVAQGGTILGSSRTNPLNIDGGIERIRDNLAAAGIDGLIAIGGDDTLGVAKALDRAGIATIGVPKTIDNDLAATDYTFGFDTAVNIATEAIDRLHTTASSHHRVIVVEVMGRDAGWIALHAGMAGGANVILIPERDFDFDQVTEYIDQSFQAGQAPVVVVSEGAKPIGGFQTQDQSKTDNFGHARLGGVATWLEGEIEERTGRETRSVVLGHLQRGGTPSAFDRVLATRFGIHAIEAANDGHWGKMTALRGIEIELVDLAEAVDEPKLVTPDLYAEAEIFFG